MKRKKFGWQGKASKSSDVMSPPPLTASTSTSRMTKQLTLSQIGSFAFLPDSAAEPSDLLRPSTSVGQLSTSSTSSSPSSASSSPSSLGSPVPGPNPSPPIPSHLTYTRAPSPPPTFNTHPRQFSSASPPPARPSTSAITPTPILSLQRSISPSRSNPVTIRSPRNASSSSSSSSSEQQPDSQSSSTTTSPTATAAASASASASASAAFSFSSSSSSSSSASSPAPVQAHISPHRDPAWKLQTHRARSHSPPTNRTTTTTLRTDIIEDLVDPAIERLCLHLAPISDEDRQIHEAFKEHLLPLLKSEKKHIKSLMDNDKSRFSSKFMRRIVGGFSNFVLAVSKATAATSKSKTPQTSSVPSAGKKKMMSVGASRRVEEPALPSHHGSANGLLGLTSSDVGIAVVRKTPAVQRHAVPWPSVFYSYAVATRSTFSMTEESLLVRLTDECLRSIELLPSDAADPYIVPQIRQLRQFLECDGRLRVDLCNSLIGLEIPQRVVFDFQLSSSARSEIPSKGLLLERIQQWSQISDAFTLQRQVVALANEIRRSSFQSAKSEFVLVRLDDPVEGSRFYFGRISSTMVDGDHININLDPRERFKNSKSVSTSQICFLEASAISTFLEGDADKIATFVVDPIRQLLDHVADVEKRAVNRLLTSVGIDPMVMMLLRSPDWTSAPIRLHSALHNCVRILKDRTILPVSAFASIDTELFDLWQQSIEQLGGKPMFLSALERSVAYALRYRSESSSSRMLGEFLSHATLGLAALADKVEKIESGVARGELVNWWLDFVHQKTEEFLAAMPGWRAPTNEELLGDKIPEDFNALSHSLRIINGLLDLNNPANTLRTSLLEWIQTIYARTNAFLEDLRATFAISLNVPLQILSMERLAETLRVYEELNQTVSAEGDFRPGSGVTLEQVFATPKLHASFKGYLADADLIGCYQCYQKCQAYLRLVAPNTRQQLSELASDIINEYAKPQSIMSIGLPGEPAAVLIEQLHSANWDTAPLTFLENMLDPLVDFCETELISRVDPFLRSPFYSHYRRYVKKNLFPSSREALPDWQAKHPSVQLYEINTEPQYTLLVSRHAEYTYLEAIKKQDDRVITAIQCDQTIEPEIVSKGVDSPVPIAGLIFNRFARYQQDLVTLCQHWKIAI